MRRLWPYLVATTLLAESGCETPQTPTPPLHQLVGEAWSLEFAAAEGSNPSRVDLRHRDGTTLASVRSVRLAVHAQDPAVELAFVSAERRENSLILQCAPFPDHEVRVEMELGDRGEVGVRVADTVGLRSEVRELSLTYDLPTLANPDESWLPIEHREPDQVAADGSFHTPLAFVRRGGLACALIPDRAHLATSRPIPQALLLDRIGPRLLHGLIASQPGKTTTDGFRRSAPIQIQGQVIGFRHVLRCYRTADVETCDQLFREQWTGVLPPSKSSTRAIAGRSEAFFTGLVRDHWIRIRQGAAGTLRADLAGQTDGFESADAWYTVRNQSLRVALGMHLCGSRTDSDALRARAVQVAEHILSAPTRGGLLPTLFLRDAENESSRWVLDSRSAGSPDRYHAFDVANTCCWLLDLARREPSLRRQVLRLCARTARFFRSNQDGAGGFPIAFDNEFLAPISDPSRSAENGAIARFLVEFGEMANDPDSILAAYRSMEWLENRLASGLWMDFECAVQTRLDPRSGIPRQGTLGLIQCALAAARFAATQPSERWRKLTSRLLGQLSRYQQIWAPPWIAGARTGGMGAGNFDHRWNDARHALAALAFFTGYEVTGDTHWLERGTAALDAAMAEEAFEYRTPDDRDGVPTTRLWGPGTAFAVAEIARARLGDGVIDLAAGTGYGIEALWIEELTSAGDEISLRVLTRATDLKTARLRFRNFSPETPSLNVEINGDALGTFTADQLRSGIDVTPLLVPDFHYTPPSEVSRDVPWLPRAESPPAIPKGSNPRIDIRIGDEVLPPLPLRLDSDSGLLVAVEPVTAVRNRPTGEVIQSRLSFDVGDRQRTVPATGYRISRVSDYILVDPGEGDDAELVGGHDSRLRRFVDGREDGRRADPGGQFTYRIPVTANTTKIEFRVRAAGPLRMRAGSTVLHEDQQTMVATEPRNLQIEIADHRLWAAGELPLTFEPSRPDRGVDVASIRYRAVGRVAQATGGSRRIRRNPDKQLRVLLLPVSFVDRTLDVSRDALFQTFFGGPEHVLTPSPNSRRTVGSVARFIDSLSGGRTTFTGDVMPPFRWEAISTSLDQPEATLPQDLRTMLMQMGPADLIVAIVGPHAEPGQAPPQPRTMRIGTREVPIIFVPARGEDGSFLSVGAATAAILSARYGTRPLSTPEWGNFGSLVLSGTPSHRPPGPSGYNLALTGWADDLALETRDHDNLVISPLTNGRFGIVLDHGALPGRGTMFLECRRTEPPAAVPEESPTTVKAGLLLYWIFAAERPHITASGGRTALVSSLRLSPTHNRTRTPFTPGRAGEDGDLFLDATSRLPTATLTGERLWEIRRFRMLDNGDATFDVRYRAQDLVRSPTARWLAGKAREPLGKLWRWPANTVQDRDGEVWLRLPDREDATLRLECDPGPGLQRLFSRIRGMAGSVRVTVGSGDRTLLVMDLRGVTRRRWLQSDLPPNQSCWISFENTGKDEAQLAITSLTAIPRVQPTYAIEPRSIPIRRGVRLADGVTYGKCMVLPTGTNNRRTLKTSLVLPSGQSALRLRAGLSFHPAVVGPNPDPDAPATRPNRITAVLVNKDGSERRVLIDKAPVDRADKNLLLAISELPTAATDRVQFLEISWTGSEEIHIVDLSVIRP